MRLAITVTMMLAACAAVPQTSAVSAQSSVAAPPAPYLTREAIPDPRTFLPPPPEPGSATYAADRAAYEAALAGQGGAAWRRAITQASLRSPVVQQQIMCALGVRIEPSADSALWRLMQRSGAVLSLASEQSKAIWKRPRPYVGEAGAVTCDPMANAGTQSTSYPSGHAAAGWLWGLMLAELAPERGNELLAWGAGVGDNRIACRVHYPTDVAAGRMMGAALFARLQAEPAFRADMEAARAEISAARASGAKPDCASDQAM